jgi:hypothetical protein
LKPGTGAVWSGAPLGGFRADGEGLERLLELRSISGHGGQIFGRLGWLHIWKNRRVGRVLAAAHGNQRHWPLIGRRGSSGVHPKALEF